MEHFDNGAKRIIQRTEALAYENFSSKVEAYHLLLTLLQLEKFKLNLDLVDHNITYNSACKFFESSLKEKVEQVVYMEYSTSLKEILNSAKDLRMKYNKENVDVDLLIYVLLSSKDQGINEYIKSNNFSPFILEKKLLINNYEKIKSIPELVNINLNLRKNNRKLIGRDEELSLLEEILIKKDKPNAILIGEPGIGKTEIINELARRISKGKVNKKLLNKKIYELNIGNLVAGTKYRGEFESKLNKIVEAVKDNENIIIFVDEIHTIIDAGGAEGAISASNILKPYLSRGDIRIIGATTFDEYVKFVEKDKAFSRRFQVVNVQELSEEDTKRVLYSLLISYEKYYEAYMNLTYVEKIVDYCKQYIPNRYFPDKAIDVLDLAFSRANIQNRKRVEEEDIIAVIEKLCKIKISKESKIDILKNKLEKNIIGQNSALKQIEQNIYSIEKGLIDNNKPLGVYLFVGPSGVGKTESAKIIAESYFGSNQKLIKIDMSQFMEPNSVSKLIGSAPGYVGYKEQTLIADEIRKNPHSVILLDEIEKAHKDVLNIFLNVFDEGYFIDSNKRRVDFRNSIIIMTSNLGYNKETNSKNNNLSKVDEIISMYFTPEFINRVDEVIHFTPFNKDSSLYLGKKYLKEYTSIIDEKIDISDDYILCLLNNDEVYRYGARGIKRTIKRFVLDSMNLETSFTSMGNA